MNEAELLIVNISICLILVIISGLMSGLTVGLLSIDDLDMELALAAGDETEQKQAKKVMPIINKHHLLLVTLLLANASAMEALPIFLNELVPEYAAIIISVTFILIFGEVLPQAICTGPNQIKIAACMVPIIRFIMFLLYPISKPIAIILDKVLKHEGQKRYNREHIKALIQMHTQTAEKLCKEINEEHICIMQSNTLHLDQISHDVLSETQNNSCKNLSASPKQQEENAERKGSRIMFENQEQPLLEKEASIIQGALDIREKQVQDILIPYRKVYCLDSSIILSYENVNEILSSHYSRVPVYEKSKDNVIGILLIKDLAIYCYQHQNEVSSFKDSGIKYHTPVVVHPEVQLLDLLPIFTQGRCHMAVVSTQDYKLKNCLKTKQPFDGSIIGIVTLEDVMEVLIKEQIYDEHDFNKKFIRPSTRLYSITRGIRRNPSNKFFF